MNLLTQNKLSFSQFRKQNPFPKAVTFCQGQEIPKIYKFIHLVIKYENSPYINSLGDQHTLFQPKINQNSPLQLSHIRPQLKE